ncbi:MAG: hypothetical protein ACXU8U_00820, partial [Asticcacaulis sp.]
WNSATISVNRSIRRRSSSTLRLSMDSVYLITMSFLQNANAQGKQALTDAKAFAGKQYAELYDWVPYELIIPSNVAEYAGQ